MPKTQLQKKQQRTSPKRVLAMVVALVVAFLLLASVIGLAEKYIAIRGRVRDLKEDQRELEEKQAALRERNRYIETDEGEERELRTKYNVVKPGEEMVVITEPATMEAPQRPGTIVGRWWESLLKGLGIVKE